MDNPCQRVIERKVVRLLRLSGGPEGTGRSRIRCVRRKEGNRNTWGGTLGRSRQMDGCVVVCCLLCRESTDQAHEWQGDRPGMTKLLLFTAFEKGDLIVPSIKCLDSKKLIIMAVMEWVEWRGSDRSEH